MRVIATVLILILLSSCAEELQEPQELSLVLTTNRTDKANSTLASLARDYEALNPGLSIRIEAIKNVEEVLALRMAASRLGDIILIPPSDLHQMESLLLPLDSLEIRESDYYFYDFGLDDEGRLRALPSGVYQIGIAYHRGAFRKAGIEGTPRTWEEFLELASKLKAAGIQPMAINYQQKWPLTPFIENLPQILSGDPLFLERTLNSELFPEGGLLEQIFSRLRQLANLGYLEPDLQFTDWELMKLDHARGDIAMALLGSWYLPQMIDSGASPQEVGFFPFPESKVLMLDMDYFYGIDSSTPHPQESLELFRYLFLEEHYNQAVDIIPAKKGSAGLSPALEELLSSGLPVSEDYEESPQFRQRLADLDIDLVRVLQEYLVAEDPTAILREYNRRWVQAPARSNQF